ncbi:MAG: 50S ribosomal protein L6 [Verrucomicrobia bacterium]|nr:MAG: 50S ribosomal protein L6 [Verrucomicrobiota bacterium]
MSRKGKLPIKIPSGVTVRLDNNNVEVKGPKGSISQQFDKSVVLKLSDNVLTVEPADDSRYASAMHGTVRSIIYALVEGVEKPFSKNLEIHGVGQKAELSSGVLKLYLGYSHPIFYKIPEGINIVVTDGTKLKVEGVSKHLVGQVAARIKQYRKVEPYKGKGVRIVGEFVRRLEGKKSAK